MGNSSVYLKQLVVSHLNCFFYHNATIVDGRYWVLLQKHLDFSLL